jgi:hypothetical protein
MPLLIRLAALSDLPDGATKKAKVRGVALWVTNSGGRFEAHDKHQNRYRTEVRGDYVYVGLDPDANSAPAEVQQNGGRGPTPLA